MKILINRYIKYNYLLLTNHINTSYFISVNASTADKTVLHILKRRMGLTRRGTYHNEALTLSDLSVNQTVTFTVHETSEFVTLSIPTARILQTKVSAETQTCMTPNSSAWLSKHTLT